MSAATPPATEPDPTLVTRHHDARARIAAASPGRGLPLRSPRSGPMVPPRLPARELDGRALAELLPEHGCVWVEGAVEPARVGELRDGIDAVFDAYDRAERGEPPAPGPTWCAPLRMGDGSVHATRSWLRQGGGVFTGDSPHLYPQVVAALEDAGVVGAVTELFGTRPVGSLDKSTLRRVRPRDGIEWHQDGAFLGPEHGALNVWLSLSDCRHAPGLDVVGHRFADLVPTGTSGATYGWSVGEGVVRSGGWPVHRPDFAPGDAFLFDSLLLHRTTVDPGRPGVRHAIETWLFDPARFPPHQQVPLAL